MKFKIIGIDKQELEAHIKDLVMNHCLKTYRIDAVFKSNNDEYALVLTVNKRLWLKTWHDTGCDVKPTIESLEDSFLGELQGVTYDEKKVQQIKVSLMLEKVCEECWGNAHLRLQDKPEKSQIDHYRDLIQEDGHRKHRV